MKKVLLMSLVVFVGISIGVWIGMNMEIVKQSFSAGESALTKEVNYKYVFPALKKIEKGNFNEAIAQLVEATKITPDYARVYSILGFCYLSLEDYNKAIGTYNKAIELGPYYIGNNIYMGIAYKRNGENEQALKQLNLVLSALRKNIYPGRAEAFLIEELMKEAGWKK